MVCQILGILTLIMANGQPFKWVKFHKAQKALLHPLSYVCVQYERMWTDRHRPDGRKTEGDANTPRLKFVGRGIKNILVKNQTIYNKYDKTV